MALKLILDETSKGPPPVVKDDSKGSSLVDATLYALLNPRRTKSSKQDIEHALETALRLFDDYSRNMFVGKGGSIHQRLLPMEREAGVALLHHLFTGDPLSQVVDKSITAALRERVYLWFTLICIQEGIRGAYGQSTDWYKRLRGDIRIRRGVYAFHNQ